MIKAFAAVVSSFALLWIGIGAGVWWEHRPAGWPNFRVNVGFIHWTLRLPNSLGAQLAALQKAQAEAGTRVIQITTAQNQISDAIGLGQAVTQDRIQVQTRTIIKEVPIYVTPEVDTRFPLPVGLVRLHDAAARGVDVSAVPDPAGQPDDTASGVKPSDLAGAFAGNYGACHADAAQLADLQAWIRQQAAIPR